MIRIQIGTDERTDSSIDFGWIKSQLDNRRHDGQTVCVRVTIKKEAINLALATPTCRSSGGGAGNWTPSLDESEVLKRWNNLHLNTPTFTSSDIWAFIQPFR